MKRPSRMLHLSLALYRLLLVLYPRPFRHEYGPSMAQLFRDTCRDAERSRGAVGIFALWQPTLIDLCVSALKERWTERYVMSRITFIRLGGILAIVGAALSLVATFLSFHTNGSFNGDGFYFAEQVCFAVALVSVFILQTTGWGRITMAVALFGFFLNCIYMLMLIYRVGFMFDFMRQDGRNVVSYGEGIIAIVTFGSFCLNGIATLRQRLLGRWSFLPLAMAVWGIIQRLLGGLFIAYEVQILTSNTSSPPITYELLWWSVQLPGLLLWVTLGFALLYCHIPATEPLAKEGVAHV